MRQKAVERSYSIAARALVGAADSLTVVTTAPAVATTALAVTMTMMMVLEVVRGPANDARGHSAARQGYRFCVLVDDIPSRLSCDGEAKTISGYRIQQPVIVSVKSGF